MTVHADRIAVLDTSVFEHDPGALFRFRDEVLIIPAAVVESLDPDAPTLDAERSRNLRAAASYLENLLTGVGPRGIEAGFPGRSGSGRLVTRKEEPGGYAGQPRNRNSRFDAPRADSGQQVLEV